MNSKNYNLILLFLYKKHATKAQNSNIHSVFCREKGCPHLPVLPAVSSGLVPPAE